MIRPVLVVLLAFLASAGPAGAGEIVATGAWARATVSTGAAAAYLTLRNPASTTESLVGAETPIAKRVELHATTEADGVMRMRPVPELVLQPGTAVTLAPRGVHLMLLELARPLKEGERFELILRFAGGRRQTIEVAVARAGAMAPPGR